MTENLKKRRWILFTACILAIACVSVPFLTLHSCLKTVPSAKTSETMHKNYKSRLKQTAKAGNPEPASVSGACKHGCKTAFLTFDDGPSALTPELLDTLKKNGVCATFFIVGLSAEKYPDTLNKMVSDGDVIGVHSWSHRYSYIYKNTDNFLTDFNKLDSFIYCQTGIHSDICRFPGGTNNTVCRHYSKGNIMRHIVTLVHKKGFEYYDWNVSSGEASSSPPSKSKITENVLSQCKDKNTAVILFHDTNNQTYIDALPGVISGLKSEGFTFDTLSVKRLTGETLRAVQFVPS